MIVRVNEVGVSRHHRSTLCAVDGGWHRGTKRMPGAIGPDATMAMLLSLGVAFALPRTAGGR